ncbi:MAG: type II secretion system protein J [Lachnospiraceae bacterium]
MRTNNKGISLIEMIVSIGVMSILMVLATTMLTNAARFFEKHSAIVDLQNEAQIVTNYLSEAVMEATRMDFTQAPSGGVDCYKFFKEGSKGNQRILYFDQSNTSLYMYTFQGVVDETTLTDFNTLSDAQKRNYLISNEVTAFEIKLDKYVETPPVSPPDPAPAPVDLVKNPIKANITFTIEHANITRSFSITADCRNILDYVVIDGTTIEAVNR